MGAVSFDSMRHTGLELFPQGGVVDVAADQHQLILAITGPVGVVDGKAFARQMEHMAAFAFVEPQDSFGPEHLLGHLVVEEVLELAQREGAITLEGHGGKSLDVLMVTVVVAVVMVSVVMTVPMAVGMTVIVPMAVIVFMTVIVVMAAVAMVVVAVAVIQARIVGRRTHLVGFEQSDTEQQLSLIHISEPTRRS